MAVTVVTTEPAALLAAIKKNIDEGHIRTWSCDSDGDFTHTPSQWIYKAWLCPQILNGALVLGILGRTDVKMTIPVYAVYHSSFIEMLLNHFDHDFTSASASALPVAGTDTINPSIS